MKYHELINSNQYVLFETKVHAGYVKKYEPLEEKEVFEAGGARAGQKFIKVYRNENSYYRWYFKRKPET